MVEMEYLKFIKTHSDIFSSNDFQLAYRRYRNTMKSTNDKNIRSKIEDAWRKTVFTYLKELPKPVYDDHMKLTPKPIYDKTWKSSGDRLYDEDNMIDSEGRRVFNSKKEYKKALKRHNDHVKKYNLSLINRRAADMCGVLFRDINKLLEFRNNGISFGRPSITHVKTFEANMKQNFVL